MRRAPAAPCTPTTMYPSCVTPPFRCSPPQDQLKPEEESADRAVCQRGTPQLRVSALVSNPTDSPDSDPGALDGGGGGADAHALDGGGGGVDAHALDGGGGGVDALDGGGGEGTGVECASSFPSQTELRRRQNAS